MMVELEANIKETTRIMTFYERKDSTIFLSITNQLTAENFKSNTPDNLFNLNTFYTKAYLSNEAWTKLMDISDIIPVEFKNLVSELDYLYNVRYGAVIGKNEIMGDITDEYVQYLSDNYSWFTPKSSNDGSLEQEIDYRLNSYIHRNRINLWYIQGVGNHLNYIISYRQNALEVYNEIRNLLNTSTSDNEIFLDEETADHFQGAWRSDRFPDYQLELKYNEGRLFLNFNQDTITREVFYVSENKLNQFPFIPYEGVEQENWQGDYSIGYYTIIQKDGELILKDYFSEWHRTGQ